ncbi:acyl-CoA dehydrogenase family protein [Variovorax sp. RHLX14]|uniref:acyl-CoA dehydrogenase family protein n=1 Tax=Variovorax sp. RHLX14 TaxID=1259731 RepID=UPI003F46567E
MPSTALLRSPLQFPARETYFSDALLADLTAQFAATAADHDRDGAFPRDNFATLQRHGLIGLLVPTASGGSGATLGTARRVIGAVARGEPATALILTMTYLQHRAIARADSRWPGNLRERVLRDGAQHGALVNSLRVEPELGSPARGGLPGTVGRRTADGWRIDGHKLYTTGIEGLSWLSVWGRTDEPEPRVGIFLVPRNAPGLRVIASWDHLGMRASGSHEVIFEDVKIPLEHGVDLRTPAEWAAAAGNATDGAAYADQQAWMVVLLGTLYDAVARAAQDWLLTFLHARAPASLGAPLSSLPRVQEQVGEIASLLRTNQLLLDHTAAEIDAGRIPAATDSGLLKHTVTANAIRVVELALKLSGNHGLSRSNPLERHYRDVLCGRIHTPQDDAVLVAAGKAALGAHSFP